MGWPSVSYLAGFGGCQVGAAAAWVGGAGFRIMLAPGEAAHMALTFAHNPMIGVSAQCPGSVRTVWLRVYPPDQYVPALVRLEFTAAACTNGFETVFAGPLRPGAA